SLFSWLFLQIHDTPFYQTCELVQYLLCLKYYICGIIQLE
ncbi:hypothetical protein NT04LM_1976a, partial [Listeria monocytogenes FSL F2-208]